MLFLYVLLFSMCFMIYIMVVSYCAYKCRTKKEDLNIDLNGPEYIEV